MRGRIIFFTLFVLASFTGFAQTDSLKQRIDEIVKNKKATVGVGILGIENDFSLSYNTGKHFPMQSVFKFHIALAVLNLVDEGKLSLDQKIHIKKSQLRPKTWSPIRDKYPQGNIRLPLSEILKYTVSQSDNNGCDILLKLIGGTKKIQKFLNSKGMEGFNICANEEEMSRDWNVQYKNWSTPESAAALLKAFYHKKLLAPATNNFLWKVMVETSTGEKRLKGNLPEGTQVAHKTGTSGEGEKGIAAATNDIGIITLPNGSHFAIAVFVSDSSENNETNEKIIAEIAKTVWDYFINK